MYTYSIPKIALFFICPVLIFGISCRSKQADNAINETSETYQSAYKNEWGKVKKTILESWHQSRTTDSTWQMPGSLKIPYQHFTIASGNRNVQYCWDTYFTNAGLLLIDSLAPYAKNAVENQFAEIDQIGFVPNASEPWALNRSQTPFLSMMVREIYEKGQADKTWLKKAYNYLKQDYHFWTDASKEAIEDHITPITELQCYSHHATDEELLAFFSELAPRFGFSDTLPETEKLDLANHWMAEAESMDFTPRFDNRCMDFIPVDLNANLYGYEKNFDWMVKELGLKNQPDWDTKAKQRKTMLNKYCWSEERGMFLDYDFVNNKHSSTASIVTFYPMWMGMASKEQAARIVENISLFEFNYGPAVCERKETA